MAKHIHRYEKVVMGRKNYTVFRCNLPDCAHYVNAKLAKGKLTICNRCGTEMILDARAMKFVKPYCVDCVQTTKRKDTHARLLEYIQANNPESKKSTEGTNDAENVSSATKGVAS